MQTNNIEIDLGNDTFVMVQRTVTKTGKASELVRLMSASEEVESPMLPEHCVLYKRVKKLELFVMFQPPSIEYLGATGVIWTGTGEARRSQEVQFSRIPVGMPARVTVIPFVNKQPFYNHIRLVFSSVSKRELFGLDTVVLNPWFPNSYQNIVGQICIGDGVDFLQRNKELANNTTLACKAILRYLDTSTYNKHVIQFLNWTDMTKLQPPINEVGSFPNNPLWVEVTKLGDRDVDIAIQQLVRLNRLTAAAIKEVGESNAAEVMHLKAFNSISSRTTLNSIMAELISQFRS